MIVSCELFFSISLNLNDPVRALEGANIQYWINIWSLGMPKRKYDGGKTPQIFTSH